MRSPLSLLQLLPVPPAPGLHGAVAVDRQESCALGSSRTAAAVNRTWAHQNAGNSAHKNNECT